MRTSQKVSALTMVLAAVAAVVYTIASHNQPLLGLDLQGGVSVVLQPSADAEVEEEALVQAVEIIRNRVDSLGVAEPEISRQGSTIVVDLPGVEEQQRALELIGQTAELRFRPVIAELGPAAFYDLTEEELSDLLEEGPDSDENGDSGNDTGIDSDETEEGLASPAGGRFSAAQAEEGDADGEEPANTDADAEGEEPANTDADAPEATASPAQLEALAVCEGGRLTAPEDDDPERPVVLDDINGQRLCLGPSLLKGDTLETADVGIGGHSGGGWTVNPVFRPGADGIDSFNAAAAQCYVASPNLDVCPTGRLAIVLDQAVVSAPTINEANFDRDRIVISGNFTEESARDLASVLKFGALPLELETQQARTVSATVGEDVLRAGVIAGLIGLSLVGLYLLAYYRLAGLVAISGLLLSAAFLWAIIAWLGESVGLALTLAGVVGLIVSIGVSTDSNIVYFENVKDAYKGGRRITTSVERAYQTAISTIVKADVVSLIAAVLLYWLTVGAVRGFAFYLGLATVLDLVVSWFFMRPALMFLARRKAVEKNPALLGLPAGGQ